MTDPLKQVPDPRVVAAEVDSYWTKAVAFVAAHPKTALIVLAAIVVVFVIL